jgi:hypothetical protein
VIVAISVSSTMGKSKEVMLHEGESTRLGRYTLTFVKGEHLRATARRSWRGSRSRVAACRSVSCCLA